MTRLTALLLAPIILVGGCETFFLGYNRTPLEPVNVSGTTYEVYMVEEATPVGHDDLNHDSRPPAVYAVVGGGETVYCGTSRDGCEAAIRRHNANQQRGGGTY